MRTRSPARKIYCLKEAKAINRVGLLYLQTLQPETGVGGGAAGNTSPRFTAKKQDPWGAYQ